MSGRVVQHAGHGADHGVLVALDEFAESPLVALGDARHQGDVHFIAAARGFGRWYRAGRRHVDRREGQGGIHALPV